MTTTTPIQQVSIACAQLWAQYDVTMVPPPDVIAQMHFPLPPAVMNHTNGQVSDAEAQRIGLANQLQSAWYVWATKYSQGAFLTKIASTQAVGQQLWA